MDTTTIITGLIASMIAYAIIQYQIRKTGDKHIWYRMQVTQAIQPGWTGVQGSFKFVVLALLTLTATPTALMVRIWKKAIMKN